MFVKFISLFSACFLIYGQGTPEGNAVIRVIRSRLQLHHHRFLCIRGDFSFMYRVVSQVNIDAIVIDRMKFIFHSGLCLLFSQLISTKSTIIL